MCSVSNCINYINNQCIANKVQIGNNKKLNSINCSTYKPNSSRDNIESYFNTNYLNALVSNLDYEDDMIHKIVCYCKECTYNFADFCTSTDINVYGKEVEDFSNTCCKTFFRK